MMELAQSTLHLSYDRQRRCSRQQVHSFGLPAQMVDEDSLITDLQAVSSTPRAPT